MRRAKVLTNVNTENIMPNLNQQQRAHSLLLAARDELRLFALKGGLPVMSFSF